ncbi:MAG TPA: AAA family ATPase [Pseudobacteroides sp.]|nr:AAA family ATPase [Pseudobacteroides sp.]
MAIIAKVKIENFQSHENTTIDFHSGLNIITGPSDNGKSAIIRAIKWVLFNEPRGTDFIRQGTSGARVTIEMDNGNSIIRERTAGKNRYTVIYPDGEPKVFEGFGNDIPQEVVEAHGITKAYLDSSISSSLNIAEQLEGPFLLSETGSVRAKAIGRLIGLHIIDRAIKNTNVDLRRENQFKDKTSSELDEVESKLKEYEFLKEVEERLEKSDRIIQDITKELDRKKKLETNLKSIISIEADYNVQSNIVKRLQKLERYELCLKNIEIVNEKLTKLKKAYNSLNEKDIEINSTSNIIKNTERVYFCAELLDDIYKKERELEKAINIKAEFSKVIRSESETKAHLYATSNVKLVDEKIKKLDGLILKLSSILSLNEDLSKLKSEQQKYESVLNSTAYVEKAITNLNEIQKNIEKLQKAEKLRDELIDVNNRIDKGNECVISYKTEIDKLLQEYSVVLKKAGKCPVCQSKIGNDILNDIIKSYSVNGGI